MNETPTKKGKGRPSKRPKDAAGNPIVIDWSVETPESIHEKYGTPYPTACYWRRMDIGKTTPGPKPKTTESAPE